MNFLEKIKSRLPGIKKKEEKTNISLLLEKISNSLTSNKKISTNELLIQNLEVNREILKRMKRVDNYVLWARLWFGFKVFIIAIPIALGVIYLPPFLDDLYFRVHRVQKNIEKMLGLNSDQIVENLRKVLNSDDEKK